MAIDADLPLTILRHFLLLLGLLTPLELLRPARGQPLLRRGIGTDLLHFACGPVLIRVGAALLLGALGAALDRLLPAGPRAQLRAQPFALQLVEIFVLGELGAYLLHRLSHAVPALWRLHAVHHSNEALDWLAAHRQHPIEAVLHLGVANLPVLALGFSLEPILGFILLQKVYTAFLHANVRVGYGPLSVLLASPQFHHWHHDAEAGAAAGNYASTLPLFDLIFGTYRAPQGFPARYGLDGGEVVPEGYLAQLAHPFRR